MRSRDLTVGLRVQLRPRRHAPLVHVEVVEEPADSYVKIRGVVDIDSVATAHGDVSTVHVRKLVGPADTDVVDTLLEARRRIETSATALMRHATGRQDLQPAFDASLNEDAGSVAVKFAADTREALALLDHSGDLHAAGDGWLTMEATARPLTDDGQWQVIANFSAAGTSSTDELEDRLTAAAALFV